jgi:Fur family ferric uptake transcriptional regulator
LSRIHFQLNEYNTSTAAYDQVYFLLQIVAGASSFTKGERVLNAYVDFVDRLHAQGYRLTPQRHLILDIVRQTKAHITPEQIYESVQQQNPAISRATIYRTLDFLCELRLIHALRWGDRTYYEIAEDEPHHHLICRQCNGVEQIDHTTLARLIATIDRRHHFSVDMDHVAFFGLCRRCRSSRSAVRRRQNA